MQNNPYASVPGCNVNIVKTYNFHIVEKSGKYGVWVIDPEFVKDYDSPGYFAAQTGEVFTTIDEAERYAKKCLVDPTFAQELRYAYSNNKFLRDKIADMNRKLDEMGTLIETINEPEPKQFDIEFERERKFDESREQIPGLPEAI